jgi:choline-glycine betaine transporter
MWWINNWLMLHMGWFIIILGSLVLVFMIYTFVPRWRRKKPHRDNVKRK